MLSNFQDKIFEDCAKVLRNEVRVVGIEDKKVSFLVQVARLFESVTVRVVYDAMES